MRIVLAKVVQTCSACPSQWDAWGTDGRYYYLRYRSGVGTVDSYADPDPDTWGSPPEGAVARFDTSDGLDGFIALDDFMAATDLVLASDEPPLSA